MNRTSGRIIAALVSIAIFVLAAVIQNADVYNLNKQVTTTLVIVSGVAGLVNNWLPSLFGGSTTATTTESTTTTTTPPKP